MIDRPNIITNICYVLQSNYVALLGQRDSKIETIINAMTNKNSAFKSMKFISVPLPRMQNVNEFKELFLLRLKEAVIHIPQQTKLTNNILQITNDSVPRTVDLRLRLVLDTLGKDITAKYLVIVLHAIADVPEEPLKNLLLILREYHDQRNYRGEPGEKLRFLVAGDARLWSLCYQKKSDASPFNIAQRIFLDDFTLPELQIPDIERAKELHELTYGIPSFVEYAVNTNRSVRTPSSFFGLIQDHWNVLPLSSQELLKGLAAGSESFLHCQRDYNCLKIPVVNSPWMEAFWGGFLQLKNQELEWRSPIHLAFVQEHGSTKTSISIHTSANADFPNDIQHHLSVKRAQGLFDVFLCHNGDDKQEVRAIGEQLKARGILPWLDEWELRPGEPWQPQLEMQVQKIKSAVVFVGTSGIGPWQHMELRAFLSELVKRECPVIPALLSNASSRPQLPLFLHQVSWVDFHIQTHDQLERLIWGITGKRNEVTESKLITSNESIPKQGSLRTSYQIHSVFLSYSSEDMQLLNHLKTHLAPLQRVGLINTWYDRDIKVGADRQKEIDIHLMESDLILLLVSPDFMASDYCYGVEMQRALKRHEQNEACVIPIILRPVYWQNAPFSNLQILPRNAEPIISPKHSSIDEAFLQVIIDIHRIIDELGMS